MLKNIEQGVEPSPVKTAIVHDWILDIGGSEACLEQIYRLYPSDVYTLLMQEQSVCQLGIDPSRVRPSVLQKCPRAAKHHRWYLPLFPLVVEQFDLSEYDVVISSSHAVAKGVLTNAHQLHICYCHTPSRYAWDLFHLYLRESGLDKGLRGQLAALLLHYFRLWDVASAHRADLFIANSRYIARRIKKIYGREATVIHPPVDVHQYSVSSRKEDYYLTVSRMVPYKRMELIVDTFSGLPDKKLVIIGDGPGLSRIRSKAAKNVEVLGRQPFDALKDHLRRAKAFIIAAEEDFGIAPVEAQACGTPVIAYGRGGVLDTIVPLKDPRDRGQETDEQPTGVFFYQQTTDALASAIRFFEKHQQEFDGHAIRERSLRFSAERFQQEFKQFVETAVYDHFPDRRCR